MWLQTKAAEASSQTEWEASKVVSSQLHTEGNFEILNMLYPISVFSFSLSQYSYGTRAAAIHRGHREQSFEIDELLLSFSLDKWAESANVEQITRSVFYSMCLYCKLNL